MLLTKESKPPFRHHSGRDSQCRAGASPHCVFHRGRDYKCRLQLRRGDARGEAPCIRKLKNLPLPRRGRGAGGWGLKIKLKAGAAGGKEGKPPFRHHSGRDSRCRAGASPPPGTCSAGTISAAGGLIPGCRGRSPRRNKLKIPPSRRGRALCERGSGGWGQEQS